MIAFLFWKFHDPYKINLTTGDRNFIVETVNNYYNSSFKYDSLEKNGSDGSVIINYDNNKKAFYVSAACELSYVNTEGGAVQENVYLRKINNVWKIVDLMSLDRYVGYRVGSYEYLADTKFLIQAK